MVELADHGHAAEFIAAVRGRLREARSGTITCCSPIATGWHGLGTTTGAGPGGNACSSAGSASWQMSSAAPGHLEMWAAWPPGISSTGGRRPADGQPGRRWSFPTACSAASVAAASREPGHQQVLVADDVGRCWTRAWEDDRWWPWAHAGINDATAVGMSSAGLGHLEMWVVQTQGELRHRWWTQDGEWSSWETMDRPVGSRLVSVAGGSPSPWIQQILAMNSDGQLWHRHWAGVWQLWNVVF